MMETSLCIPVPSVLLESGFANLTFLVELAPVNVMILKPKPCSSPSQSYGCYKNQAIYAMFNFDI